MKRVAPRRPGERFKRAVEFADRNDLRYVVRQTGVKSESQPVAPYLTEFVDEELGWILTTIADFHATLVDQITPVASRRGETIRLLNDRMQALLGELELARVADE